jgi:hypothetical protein
MPEANWTASMVEERFAEAADVMKRLPEVRVPGYFSTWPKALQEFADLVGQEPPRLYRPPPASDAIGRMEITLDWLFWLEPDTAKLVWARASNKGWKQVCYQVGMSRSAAWRQWVMALCVIAMKLNGERIPRHRSQLEAMALRRRRACR